MREQQCRDPDARFRQRLGQRQASRTVGEGVHVDAELIAPSSLPYGGRVLRGRERIAKWFG